MKTQKTNFKETEIGLIPEEWEVSSIDSIAEIIGGGTPKTQNKEYWDGDIPWLSVVDFGGDSRHVYETEKTITRSGLENSSTVILDKGALIISARGTVGEVAQLGKSMAFNQSCYGLKAKRGISNDYLYYLLKKSVSDFKQKSHGAVFDTITRETFKNILVPIPPKTEREKITTILSCLDDKIELNRQINANLEKIASALFKRWFVDFEFPDEKGRPYKSSGGKMVETEMGEVPEGWRIGKLSEISEITIGRTPPRMEQQWFSTNPGDKKWISIRDMGNCGIYIDQTAEYLTREAIEKFNIPVIPKNTVVVSFKLTVGRVAITADEMLSNEAIAHIKLNDSVATTEYIYCFLKRFDFTSLASTSSIATAVNSKSIKEIPIVIPTTAAILEFTKLIEPIFKTALNAYLQNETLSQTRDKLLPRLISGKMRVH